MKFFHKNSSLMGKLLLVSIFFAFTSRSLFALEPAEDIKTQVEQKEPVKLSKFPVILNIVEPFGGMPLTFFKDLTITVPKVVLNDVSLMKAGFSDNYIISGSVDFFGLQVNAQLIEAIDAQNMKQQSFMVEIPKGWKISQMFPSLSKFDELELPTGRFILSTFDYTDPLLKYSVKKGFNFAASINLTGPLAAINQFISQMIQNKAIAESIIFEPGILTFGGVFNKEDVTKSSFNVTIPLRIGVDFTKATKEPPKFITKVMTDDLVASIAPGDLKVSVTTGARLFLTTQTDPLIFKGNAAIEPTTAKFSLMMDGTYDPAFGQKWLGLGNFGIELDFSPTAPATALGIPLSGFGLRGDMKMGTPPNDVLLKLAGKLELAADKLGDIALFGQVTNVKISTFIEYLVNKIAKKPVDMSKIPSIEITKASLGMAPKDTYIATKLYKKGMSVSADITLFNVTGGFDFIVDPVTEILSGGGRISNITTPFINITGPGPDKKYGTEDDGPLFNLTVLPADPSKTKVEIIGEVEIPFLNMREETNIALTQAGGQAKIMFGVGTLFNVLADCTLNFTDFTQSHIALAYTADDTFQKFFQQEVPRRLEVMRENAKNDIELWGQKMEEAQAAFEADVSAELTRVNTRLTEIDNREKEIALEIKTLEEDCFSVSILKRIGRESCKQIDKLKWEKTGLDLEKAGLIVYRETLLEPGHTVADATLALTEKIAQWKVLQDIAKATVDVTTEISKGIAAGLSIFTIREAKGAFRIVDIKELKLPRIDRLVIDIAIPNQPVRTLTLENLQIDFKRPLETFSEIAKQIVDKLLQALGTTPSA